MAKKKLTYYDRFMSVLKDNENRFMTTREIAEVVIEKDKEFFEHRIELKRKLNREQKLNLSENEIRDRAIAGIIASVSSDLLHIKASSRRFKEEGGEVTVKPLRFAYINKNSTTNNDKQTKTSSDTSEKEIDEKSLYPLLIQYLYDRLDIYSMRIDEKTSSNNKGKNGNQWLHPDIVGLQILHNDDWNGEVVECLKSGHQSEMVDLYSFEVKIKLDISNVRECFFQALSNSAWANYSYIVATTITEEASEELRILSNQYGMGVIVLNTDIPNESDIMYYPVKSTVGWEMVNRIATQNKDFERYVKEVRRAYREAEVLDKYWDYEQYVKAGLIEESDE